MQASWPANPRLKTLHWPSRTAHKPFMFCSLPTPPGSLPASRGHAQLLDFPKHARLFRSLSLCISFCMECPFPPAYPCPSPRFSANITSSADQLKRTIMEAALTPGSQSSQKTDGKEYNLLGLKARPWKCWLVSLKALPGQSILEKEWKEGARMAAPHIT